MLVVVSLVFEVCDLTRAIPGWVDGEGLSVLEPAIPRQDRVFKFLKKLWQDLSHCEL